MTVFVDKVQQKSLICLKAQLSWAGAFLANYTPVGVTITG